MKLASLEGMTFLIRIEEETTILIRDKEQFLPGDAGSLYVSLYSNILAWGPQAKQFTIVKH